jgi:hypothetical protein
VPAILHFKCIIALVEECFLAQEFIKRSLQPVLEKVFTQFPAVVVTGPRQSGKTTLLKHHFEGRCGYESVEPPDVRAAAVADPRGFLAAHHSDSIGTTKAIAAQIAYRTELSSPIRTRRRISVSRISCFISRPRPVR